MVKVCVLLIDWGGEGDTTESMTGMHKEAEVQASLAPGHQGPWWDISWTASLAGSIAIGLQCCRSATVATMALAQRI